MAINTIILNGKMGARVLSAGRMRAERWAAAAYAIRNEVTEAEAADPASQSPRRGTLPGARGTIAAIPSKHRSVCKCGKSSSCCFHGDRRIRKTSVSGLCQVKDERASAWASRGARGAVLLVVVLQKSLRTSGRRASPAHPRKVGAQT